MMQADVLKKALTSLTLFFLAFPAIAHIEYYDLNQKKQIGDLTAAGKAIVGNDIPISNPVYWTSTYQSPTSSGESWGTVTGSYASGTWSTSVHIVTMDSSGWTDGLRNNPTGGANLLGDTHKVNFANFHLNQAAYVTISLTDGQAGTGYGLNPSFSLYAGSAVYQAHDAATADPSNPLSGVPPVKLQSTKDNGSTVDSQGIVSAYRNTLTNTGSYYGQFNALGDFSVANSAGNWTAVHYLTSVTGTRNANGTWAGNSNSNSLSNYLLPAGDYIIAFSGNAQPLSYATQRSADTTSSYGTVTNLGATLTFSAISWVSADSDNDGVSNGIDNCPAIANSNQLNTDGDSQGDACDTDDDNDGVPDVSDAFPLNASESVDTDNDGTGNNADLDDDGDGVPDYIDADPLNPIIATEKTLPLNGVYKGSSVRENTSG